MGISLSNSDMADATNEDQANQAQMSRATSAHCDGNRTDQST